MNSGHIRKRGKNSWEIKWEDTRDPISGKRRPRYQTVRGTKADAKVELTRRLAEIADGTAVRPGQETLGELVDSWLTNVAPGKASAKTLERWRELAACHIKPQLGAVRLKDLNSERIEAFYRDREQRGRVDGRGGLSPRTVLHIHRLLAQILDSAVRKHKILRNPAKEAENKPKPGHADITVLTASETAKLIDTARDTRLFAPVFLALTTGMRRGEILGLRWQDVELDAGSLTVHQTVEQTRAGIGFKEPKTRAGRRKIALATVTIDALRRHRVEQLKECFALGLGRPALVFTRHDGDVINPLYFTKEFSRLSRRAGLRVSFHGLRHSHATALLRDGVNIKVVSERLGHADIALTLKTYAHVLPDMQEAAVRQIEAAFANTAGTR